MDTNKILGLRIKGYRESIGMSQQELAVKVGYKHKASIARIEAGLSELPAGKVTEFAKALGVEVPDIIKGLAEEARFEIIAEQFAKNVLKSEPKPDNYLRPIMNILIGLDDEELDKAYRVLNTMFGGSSNGNTNLQ